MEKSYKKVWISQEGRALIKRGLEKIGVALDWLEHDYPGFSDRYIAMTSMHFRHNAAMTASSDKVSVFRIYCWLCDIMRKRKSTSYPTLAKFLNDHFKPEVSGAVEEAAKHEERHAKARKESLHSKVGKVRDCILPNAKRTEDYIDGVKYRVIVYFGRNYR